MEVSKTDQVLAGLASIFNRELTDDEKASVVYWQNCRELLHFVEGFPNEWKLFKEMLNSYVVDMTRQWRSLIVSDPDTVGNLSTIHAKVHGANQVVSAFIQDVENAPKLASEVPDIVKEGYERLRVMPQEV